MNASVDTWCPRHKTTWVTCKTGITSLGCQQTAPDVALPHGTPFPRSWHGSWRRRPCLLGDPSAQKPELQGAKHSFLCWHLVARKQKLDPCPDSPISKSECQQTLPSETANEKQPTFQSSGSFHPKLGFKALKSHIHMNPSTILKMSEVNMV